MQSLDGRFLPCPQSFEQMTNMRFFVRRHFIHRDTLAAASAIYKGTFADDLHRIGHAFNFSR